MIDSNKKNILEISINEDGYLIRKHQLMPIRIIDDYFYKDNYELDLYIEDGQIFQQIKIFSFISWLKITKPTGFFIDENKNIFSVEYRDSAEFIKLLNLNN